MFSGSIAALITPMTSAGDIDKSRWLGLLDWHLDSGTDGVVVAGTTGESATLTADEFSWLLSSALERSGGRMSVLAGTGFPSTAQTIERTRTAAKLSADAALVVAPAYNRPSQRGLEAHFRAVADAATIPVVLYNVPSRTAVDLKPETSLRLFEHDNIVAIKEAVGAADRVAELLAGDMPVLSGDDPTCCERMLDGAAGVISVAANVIPGEFVRMCKLALAGETGRAREENARFAELYEFLSVESNPVPVKWLLAQMERIEPGLRLPLVSLDESFHARGRALMREFPLDVAADVA